MQMRMMALMAVLLAVCLAAIMASGWLLPVRAAEPSVTFRGLEEGFKFAPGSEYTATDLFQNFQDIYKDWKNINSGVYQSRIKQ